MTVNLATLQTEQKNSRTTNIDTVSSLELCRKPVGPCMLDMGGGDAKSRRVVVGVINAEDRTVADAVETCLPQIAAAIDVSVAHLLAGGRIVYTGAGTSGRLGILDASEIPPTFSSPPGQFVGLIAGGDQAIRNAVEGAEDSEAQGAADLAALSPPLSKLDVLIGIASSGRTPYVLGSLKHARSVGAASIGLACVRPSAFDGQCDVLIECVTGPEVVTGSTRLKAGTATKMILNMISTGSQITVGKTYGNLMVDLKMSNEKLRDRARRVVRSAVPDNAAVNVEQDDVLDGLLARCGGDVKLSILVAALGCSPDDGRTHLQASAGSLRRALSDDRTRISPVQFSWTSAAVCTSTSGYPDTAISTTGILTSQGTTAPRIKMVVLNVLGLNCGTSVDGRLRPIFSRMTDRATNEQPGVDVAHCRISSDQSLSDVRIELLQYTEVAVDPAIRSQVLRLCRPNQAGAAATSMAEVCDLNFALGREFARAVEQSGIDLAAVDLIASHGQTLWHEPAAEHRSTLQMAEPAVIAQQTKKTVVSGFRVAEVAAGRQGAPLSGFFEACLLSEPGVTRNQARTSGGWPTGNATVLLDATKTTSTDRSCSYFAFDTGPGNVFIDAAMRILTDGRQHYDRDGELGARGEAQIDIADVDAYLASEPYFGRQPPKTTGRELFSDDVARVLVERLQARGHSPEAIIATITRITAESVARAYEDFVLPHLAAGAVIDEIYICGGGAYNPNILRHLQARFPLSRVARLDQAPTRLEASAKEAVLFALLGFLCVCGRSVPVAADAETTEPAILGVVTPGDNYRDVMAAVVTDPAFGRSSTLGRILMVEPRQAEEA
ncbi:glucokinase regulator family [Grosmannia clavigera kw1407]|uniref:Glucokinase regulator family n=1 Tax=Grosmannia clavigera (strain kw1407 / UAMH 11150) TaxID=655863 RepID=F0XU57_GROCL|nr:glucokinase regulator family [Grosmannia clavigera kw1407]EFW98652.1 glucokinase regulator family [Grosmannia clavigera kw1407]